LAKLATALLQVSSNLFAVWVVLEWKCLEGVDWFVPSKLDNSQLDLYLPDFMVVMVKIITVESKMRAVCPCNLFCGVINYAARLSSPRTLRVHVASRFEEKLKKIISNLSAL
jgi:hypothetical protein